MCAASESPGGPPFPEPARIAVVMPLRDDWISAATLIDKIDKTVSAGSQPVGLDIVLVDDCSVAVCDAGQFQLPFQAVQRIEVVRLRRNVGHQRAIAIGLAHLQRTANGDAVIVMDADGEDTPEGVRKLIDVYRQSGSSAAVFAERSRRVESRMFRMFYLFYRIIHRALTGIGVKVGNFSILPWSYLDTLVIQHETWNHYAAAVVRSALPIKTTPIPRGYRIAGHSKMNFVSLVTHGLSAISVFSDIIGVRMLILSLLGFLLTGAGITLVVSIRLFTTRAIPGWATYAAGTLAVILMQCVTIAASFTFFMLANRTNMGFIPLRDHTLFIANAADIYNHE